MITDQVIKEIYKEYSKPHSKPEDLHLKYFVDKLSPKHNIEISNGEVVFADQEEFSPFRRFLVRSLHGILEFDTQIAFVFRNHILFLRKDSDEMRVHMKPYEKKSLFSRLFSRN